jgi:hypothetical protein
MKKNKGERSETHHTLAVRATGTSMGGTGAIEVILLMITTISSTTQGQQAQKRIPEGVPHLP